MYTSAFGLQKEPFSLTPDPDVMYLTESHREALAGLVYAVLRQRGLIVLTGEAGLGKTTIIARTLRQLPAERVKASVLVTPTLDRDEFLELVLFQFGVRDIPKSKAQRLVLLQELLHNADAKGQTALVVIDEAHTLSASVLEEVRLWGNFEKPDKKLLQIVLAGQTELGELLNRQEMRQLKQRISTRLHLEPLSAIHTAEYIRFRWTKAGGVGPHPFSQTAIIAIARISNGVPRIINGICDNVLISAAVEARKEVSEKDVLAACHELDLIKPALPVNTAASPDSVQSVLAQIQQPTPVQQISQLQQTPQVQETPQVQQAPTAYPLELMPFKTLERYQSREHKPSLLMRCASKLGMA